MDLSLTVIHDVDLVGNAKFVESACKSDERFVFLDMDDVDEILERCRVLIIRGAVVVGVVSAWLLVRSRRLANARPSVTYGPMSARDEQRQRNLTFIFNTDDTNCVDTLRMRRAPFFQLCDLFRARGLLKDSIHCNIEEQLAMFLHVVGHNQRFRCIRVPFLRSVETLSRYFQEVLYAVGELRAELIVPASTSVPTRIQNSRWNPFFKVGPYNFSKIRKLWKHESIVIIWWY